MVFDADKNARDAAAGAHAARNALAHKNPAAARAVDAIKTSTFEHYPAAPEIAEGPAAAVPAGKPARQLTAGELRLAQAYLRVMDYFGPMAEVKGITVVHGKQDARTKAALLNFYTQHHKTYGLDSDAPTLGMLQSIIKQHAVYFYNKMETVAQRISADPLDHRDAESHRARISHAFEEHKPEFGTHYDKIKTLHPEMRFPLMDALNDLKNTHGIGVVIAEAYRKPEKQTRHVMLGESTAPPGYSFHSNGLAIDIYPADAHGKKITNTRDPKWQKLYEVMQKHGFYSMMREQKWDAPHHELVAKTGEMVWWHQGKDGWRDIPAANIPTSWKKLNDAAVQSASPLLQQLHFKKPTGVSMPR